LGRALAIVVVAASTTATTTLLIPYITFWNRSLATEFLAAVSLSLKRVT
jgi:hypothetical protein